MGGGRVALLSGVDFQIDLPAFGPLTLRLSGGKDLKASARRSCASEETLPPCLGVCTDRTNDCDVVAAVDEATRWAKSRHRIGTSAA